MKKIFLFLTLIIGVYGLYSQTPTESSIVDWSLHRTIFDGNFDTIYNRVDSTIAIIPQNISDLSNDIDWDRDSTNEIQDTIYIHERVDSNANFRKTPSTVITAGTNISWAGNTLNVSGTGGDINFTDTLPGETIGTKYEIGQLENQINDTFLLDTTYVSIANNGQSGQYYTPTQVDSAIAANQGGGGGSSYAQTLWGIVGTTPNASGDSITHAALDTMDVLFAFVNDSVYHDSSGRYTHVDSVVKFTPALSNGGSFYIALLRNVYPLALQDTTPESTGFTDEYQNYWNELAVKPHTDTAAFQNALVDSMVTNGYYADSIGFMYFLAQNDSTNALINVKDPTGIRAVGQNGVLHSRYEGFYVAAPDTTGYVDLRINPTDNSLNWTGTSAFHGVYHLDNYTGEHESFGTDSAATPETYLRVNGGGLTRYTVNDNSAATFWGGNSTDGFFIATQNAIESALYQNYNENTFVGGNTSTNIPTTDLYVLRANMIPDDSRSVPSTVSFVIGGAGISEDGAQKINSWVQQYHDSIGISRD